jgi:hypothetical protein
MRSSVTTRGILSVVTDDDGPAISYKVLRRGTPVRSADGVQVGTVRRAQENARENIFDGIVLDTPDGKRFVDAPEVARIAERGVTLTISAEEARELPTVAGGVRRRVEQGKTARRAKRFGRNLRDRWDRR